jgi:hypothetical protein
LFGRSRRRGRRRLGSRLGALLFKLFAFLLRLLLELPLQLLILLLEDLRINRRAIEGGAEILHRQSESHLVIGLVAHDDVGHLRLLQAGKRRTVKIGLGETAVGKTDREFAVNRFALVDDQPEARLEHQRDGQQEARDAFFFALHLVDRDGQCGRLVGRLPEVAGGVADFLVVALILAANLGPGRLHRL